MAHVELDKVSVRFRSFQGGTTGLKEWVMASLRRPQWKKNLAKQSFWGVRGIDLKLQEGDRLGIIGPNGAGKSTLLKIISRIYRPTEGKVTVQGRLAPLIEIGAGFNLELTGVENVFLNGALLGLSKDTLNERLDSILRFSGLEKFKDMPVKYYSTGMYLRLAFSIATEIPPDVLILDELYAGGDADFMEKASTRLQSVVDASKILILVAHNLEYVSRFCNRVLVLEHGQIQFDGPPKEAIAFYLSNHSNETS